MSAVSTGKAQTRASNKYRDKTYDRLEITIPKGEKERIKEYATSRNESTNSFVIRAIKETIERDSVSEVE